MVLCTVSKMRPADRLRKKVGQRVNLADTVTVVTPPEANMEELEALQPVVVVVVVWELLEAVENIHSFPQEYQSIPKEADRRLLQERRAPRFL